MKYWESEMRTAPIFAALAVVAAPAVAQQGNGMEGVKMGGG
jgi:hypothetical protein